MKRGLLAAVFLAAAALVASSPVYTSQSNTPARELVVCGWDEVFVLALDDASGGKPRRTWTWRASGRADVPEAFQKLFATTDECKPFDDGRTILITSSGDGVALVDRVKDRVLFYGRADNAHSADLLPGRRIAVAASHVPGGTGDRLILFDSAKSDRELWSDDLPSGHGVVWDQQRKVVWALGGQDIRVFELRDWESSSPKLHRVALIPLPERGGHDLAVVNDKLLSVSTSTRCWLFDRDARTFTPHPDLAAKASVKSISLDPATRRLAYVQAEGKDWWAERIHLLHPDGVVHIPGEHFYKARWIVR